MTAVHWIVFGRVFCGQRGAKVSGGWWHPRRVTCGRCLNKLRRAAERMIAEGWHAGRVLGRREALEGITRVAPRWGHTLSLSVDAVAQAFAEGRQP